MSGRPGSPSRSGSGATGLSSPTPAACTASTSSGWDAIQSPHLTSPRNRQLVEICQHVYSSATGARAVEALASGIPLVTEALREAGLPPARYFDSGIRFTVMLSQQSQIPAPTTTSPVTATPSLSGRDQLIYDLLAGAPRTASELADQAQLLADTVRRSLRALRGQGLVRQYGDAVERPRINGPDLTDGGSLLTMRHGPFPPRLRRHRKPTRTRVTRTTTPNRPPEMAGQRRETG